MHTDFRNRVWTVMVGKGLVFKHLWSCYSSKLHFHVISTAIQGSFGGGLQLLKKSLWSDEHIEGRSRSGIWKKKKTRRKKITFLKVLHAGCRGGIHLHLAHPISIMHSEAKLINDAKLNINDKNETWGTLKKVQKLSTAPRPQHHINRGDLWKKYCPMK